ncbi:MAG: Gx transporter family protein [Lachnospiraceae bacterium]|nr:Gx transporter family protein [Lachnospiraceae bacterium]
MAKSGILVALALIFSYIEHLIPMPIPVPGVKLGLANLVTLTGLFFLNPLQVLLILITRIALAGFMFGNLSTIIYSLSGGLVSFLVMILAKKIKLFSPLGVSILGGVFHNLGQLLIAMLVLKSNALIAYLPILIIIGSISGTLIGIAAKALCKYINKKSDL